VLLMHGFMGLFSFTSFLIRLPGAWTVSALHRGSLAKTLASTEVFPHYAKVLRRAVLKIWKQGRAAPVCGHSIAGIIIDHLLLTLQSQDGDSITPYAQLGAADRRLVDALRAGGIIQLATWAPSDGPHTGENIRSLLAHWLGATELDYTGFDQVYRRADGQLELDDATAVKSQDSFDRLESFLGSPVAEPLIGGFNLLLRRLLGTRAAQQRLLNANTPYIIRLVGNRLLQTASFYGLFREIEAAMHDPVAYQQRHLRALDAIIEYDIPSLTIIHEDDFLVSARRHEEEHRFLLERRKEKEGVRREQDLAVTTRFLKIRRHGDIPATDPLNPHLLIMSTNTEGNAMVRQITTAMTRFVNENLEKAARRRDLKPLASVRAWRRDHPRSRQRPAKR